MNTTKLAKLYGGLSMRERYRLEHSAMSRGDSVELRRIVNAGESRWRQVNDTNELHRLLIKFAWCHLSFQLASIAEFWKFRQNADELRAAGRDEEADKFVWFMILAEFEIAVNRDGWRLFLERNGFDDAHVIIPQMRENGIYLEAQFRPEFVQKALCELAKSPLADEETRKLVEDPIELRTAENVADELQAGFDELVPEVWPNPK